ncbi:CDC42 small effector protein 2-like [Saccostrea echinata]|uniref:CDC42 small effector protein 2-like n=1 Tax=Saccostrea echinata TaxID=191078 RepID=UPI002A830BA4|nr:CDC42 small effector protein 2-like [Saccostrea echinata]
MGDGLFSLMTCCIAEQPQPTRRRRIDATMIGNPTDFRHTGHIGSGEVASKQNVCLASMQNQMSSKGGYDHVSPVNEHLNVIDLPARRNT